MRSRLKVGAMPKVLIVEDDELIEHGPTGVIFTKPNDSRTEEYVTGKFG